MMNIRRQNSHPINRLREEMDSVFSNIFSGLPAIPFVGGATGAGFPAMNLWEDEQALFVEAEVPGVTLNDLEVTVVGNELTVRGERRDTPTDGAAHHRRERGVGSFSRAIRLPADIDISKVAASMRDGVLTIQMPKAEAAKPRRIEVQG